MMFISFLLVLNPIAEILGFISFIGAIANAGITLIAFFSSIIIAGCVMIIAALINRPVHLIFLVGFIIIICVVVFKWKKK